MANTEKLTMIRKDDLIDKLQEIVEKEHKMRLAIVDEIIECNDPEKVLELKHQNIVHTAIINTLGTAIRLINEQPVVQLVRND